MASDNQESIQEVRHTGSGAYPAMFLFLTVALGAYLGVILYTSPGKIKKADKYKTEKTYQEKPQKEINE